MILRALVRKSVHSLLTLSGASRAIAASKWRGNRFAILCYHGVAVDDEHLWDPELFVTPAFLRERLSWLARSGYRVLPLEEALSRQDAGTLPERVVVITFDDGLCDFARLAVPILEEFGFPATVYVTTYYCENQRPVPPPIWDYLLWKGREGISSSILTEIGIQQSSDLGSASSRESVLQQLRAHLHREQLTGEECWQVTKKLAASLGVDLQAILVRKILHLMTPEQVADVSARGFHVQLHTHRHRVPRDRAALHQEILENQQRLEKLTGRGARDFCYPSGLHFPETPAWLREFGLNSATLCEPGLVNSSTDRMLLPRYIDTMKQSLRAFEAWVSGSMSLCRL
jgi:peptidoglycan/xylan/chitin deacetylase (PgdA/CDA1 family)